MLNSSTPREFIFKPFWCHSQMDPLTSGTHWFFIMPAPPPHPQHTHTQNNSVLFVFQAVFVPADEHRSLQIELNVFAAALSMTPVRPEGCTLILSLALFLSLCHTRTTRPVWSGWGYYVITVHMISSSSICVPAQRQICSTKTQEGHQSKKIRTES